MSAWQTHFQNAASLDVDSFGVEVLILCLVVMQAYLSQVPNCKMRLTRVLLAKHQVVMAYHMRLI